MVPPLAPAAAARSPHGLRYGRPTECRQPPLPAMESAATDPLSLPGLSSRAALIRRLAERLEAARRGGDPGAVILCDLELGAIVDRFGPAAGEAAERAAAAAILAAVRGTDAVGRLAAGSFAVLVAGVAADQALAIAARISTEVRRRRPVWEGLSLPVAVTVGIVPFSGSETPAALLAHAGAAAAG